MILGFKWEYRGSRIAKTALKKKPAVWHVLVSNIMKNYSIQDSVALAPLKRCKKHKKGIELPKAKLHIPGQLISHKDANTI